MKKNVHFILYILLPYTLYIIYIYIVILLTINILTCIIMYYKRKYQASLGKIVFGKFEKVIEKHF